MSENEIQIFDLKTQKLMISKKGIFGSGSLHFVDQFLIWCDEDEESTAIKLNDGTANKINGAFYFLEKDLSGTGFFAKVRTPEKKNILAKYQKKNNQVLTLWSKQIDVAYQALDNRDGVLFLITKQRGEVIALNSNTGEKIWRKLFPMKEREKFTWIYRIKDDRIIIWKNTNSILVINTNTGKQEWSIDNIPKPNSWHDDANISYSNFKLSNNKDFLIGIKERHQWILDIEKGIAFPPIDYSVAFNKYKIFNQSSAFFTLDGSFIIFFDEFERKLISFNWKTEKVESITSFPIQGKENLCGWQGPIIEGDNCFLLDTFGTLYIFGKTNNK
jgi:hypothetical protein